MKWTSVIVLWCLLLVPGIATSQSSALEQVEREQQAIFDAVAPSVVFIASSKGFGSGFFVTPQLALTNAHVVGDDRRVKVVMRGGKATTGTIVERSDDHDLALVQVAQPGTPVSLAPVSATRVGSWVGAIGHGEGGVWSFTTGMVSNVYVKPGVGAIIQTQIPINQGNSGGPVFSRTGEVIGVATAKNSRAENMNFAVPIEQAVQSFEKLRKTCTCLRVTAGAKSRVFVDGRLVGRGSVTVPASRGPHEVLVMQGTKSKSRKINFPEQDKVEF